MNPGGFTSGTGWMERFVLGAVDGGAARDDEARPALGGKADGFGCGSVTGSNSEHPAVRVIAAPAASSRHFRTTSTLCGWCSDQLGLTNPSAWPAPVGRIHKDCIVPG